MFVASTKINNQIKGQEGFENNKNADLENERRNAIQTANQFGWLYKG